MWFLTVLVLVLSASQANLSGVQNLMGEPDYRQVRLHWEAKEDEIPKTGYNIKFCELQTWGPQRCRSQIVQKQEKQKDKIQSFETDIKGLRMATTYSFEIKNNLLGGREREDRADGTAQDNIIVIPTKGFSAKATQCLPHASEIEVSTGPFFGGRIAVEATDGERCAIDGEPKSPKETYTLRINHTECGSQVNSTTVATFVLVQENLPILTHSTRRFLVLCSYQPETLTVRAGINLPTRGQAQQVVPAEQSTRNSRTGRLIMQKPAALVQEVEDQVQPKQNAVPVFVMTMLVIAAIIGLIAIALKITRKTPLDNLDNISISSEFSSQSSISSLNDLDSVQQNNLQTDL